MLFLPEFNNNIICSVHVYMDTTKIAAINLFIVTIPIIVVAYATTINSYLQSNNYNKIRCDNNNDMRAKMFDSQIVPKYIIEKDYKIIPVSAATTDVLVNRCSLAAEAISQ
jgi:hypothetical protein